MRCHPRVQGGHLQIAAAQGARSHARAAGQYRRSPMKCESIRTQLTAYLDGELEGERGSAVRGHLRGCDACRQAASDEAALRDGLRALPPLDPPASLWAGVQRQLAAAEVKDAERPAWRRVLARWALRAPQIGFGGAVIAAAI